MDEPKRYESGKQIVAIVGFVIDVLILLYLIASGSSIQIRQFVETVSNSEWIRVGIYTLIIAGIFKLVDLPLSFCSNYWLEHYFGLSRQSFIAWTKDQLKALALGVVLTLAATGLIYKLLRDYPDTGGFTRASSLLPLSW